MAEHAMFTDLAAETHARIARDYLPFPAFARLLCVNKDLNAKLKPGFDVKAGNAFLATAHMPLMVSAELFARYIPYFVRPKENTNTEGKTTADAIIVSRDLYTDLDGGLKRRILSVRMPKPLPLMEVLVCYQLNPYRGMIFDDWVVKFIMESDKEGTYKREHGATGTYADGVMNVLQPLMIPVFE